MNHRKALIAAATIVGVLLAGVAAVSANIGILDNSDNGPVGKLSAAQVTIEAPRTVQQQRSQAVDGRSTSYDEEHRRDEHERDEHQRGEHEREEHEREHHQRGEYEGHDDDD